MTCHNNVAGHYDGTVSNHHLLTQANVAPVDENRDWLWVCLTGTGLGVVGTAYCWQCSRH